MRGVVISKSPSVVVAPSSEEVAVAAAAAATAGDINLSSFDKTFGPLAITALFVFEHPIQDQDPVESIKRGVSRALVHYYPLASRLAAGPAAGQVVIKCTGEGVPLVAASANCAIKDVQQELSDDPVLQQELAVFYRPPAAALQEEGEEEEEEEEEEGLWYSEAEPFVLLQVTVFSCGGFVLGVTWKHCFADGIGMGQFLQAVGELARGLPSPSVVPDRKGGDTLLGLGMPPSYFELRRILRQPSQMMTLLDITVHSSLIRSIKQRNSSDSSGPSPCCTSYCSSEEEDPAPADAVAALTFVANARKSAGAREGYYGNCGTSRLVTATVAAVASADIMDLVKMVQRAKDRVVTQADIDQLLLLHLDGYNYLSLTSWRNIGFEAPDFGGGRPARVRSCPRKRPPLPLCVTCLLSKEEEEFKVISMCVTEDHAGAFLQELANIHTSLI
uniref:Uncharacterized protein n=1 Tax=Avena sativa TaxID=4498 RepID=A0ACD5TSF1_AVESA